MVSRRRRDDRDFRRKPPRKSPKYRILVVCEGRITERQYFQAFQHDMRNPRVHIALPDTSGVPVTVVETAVRLQMEAEEAAHRERDENLRFDSIWAVVDVDEHPNLEAAQKLALQKNVHMAISNPCFELWALLHFEDIGAHVERDKLKRRLRRFVPGYEKELPYEQLKSGYVVAVSRARSLEHEAQRHEAPHRNPTTGVAHLTELIRTK